MKINDLFSKDYVLLDGSSNIMLDSFMETYDDNQSVKYVEPLIYVYLHKLGKEMFLILDCINYDFKQIDEVCKMWEAKVMAFINFHKFSKDNEDIKNYLKYNISLIILCQDELKNEDDHYRYKTEKSLVICRKVFIICNEEGEIAKNNDIKIPFYFEPINKLESEETIQLEGELNDLLPDEDLLSNNKVETMSSKETLSKDEMNVISGWIDDTN